MPDKILYVRRHDMHQSFPHAFPSDPGVYLQKVRILYFLIAIVVVVLVVRGQLSSGQFPSYAGLALCATLLALIYAALAWAVPFVCNALPVRVGPSGLKGYNGFGLPACATWESVRSAELRHVKGSPYIVLEVHGSLTGVAIPLLLTDRAGFFRAVCKHASPSHPMVQLVERLSVAAPSDA